MSAVKAILGIGAAYLLYEWYVGAFNSPAATSVVSTTSGIPVSVPTVLPSNVPVYGMPNAAQLVNAAGSNAQNIYQWNYWYYQLTGRGSNFDIAPGWPVDGSTVVDAQTYLGYLQGLGLSGLGHIINLTKLFKGVPVGSDFGLSEFSSVSGLKGIVDDAMNSAAYIDEGPMNEAAAFNGSQSDLTTADFYLAAEGQGS